MLFILLKREQFKKTQKKTMPFLLQNTSYVAIPVIATFNPCCEWLDHSSFLTSGMVFHSETQLQNVRRLAVKVATNGAKLVKQGKRSQ